MTTDAHSDKHAFNQVTEHCDECDLDTLHDVRIEIIEESTRKFIDDSKYSREPYRIAECDRCGNEEYTRMNNR